MITTKYEEIENITNCKYCGNKPKLKIIFNENLNKTQEITCCSENDICIFDSYIKIEDSIDNAIKKWNIKNQMNNEV